jgi:hypothetical protein
MSHSCVFNSYINICISVKINGYSTCKGEKDIFLEKGNYKFETFILDLN